MMNTKGTIMLETERLILRRFTIDDADAMFKNWASDPDVTKFMPYETCETLEQTQTRITEWLNYFEKSERSDVFAIILKDTGELIGTIVRREITFKLCKSCGKYFPSSAAHGNSEYCNRMFQDTGKTCKEIGSMKVYKDKVNNQPEYQEYNRAYKTHFARIKYGKMTKEYFQEWAEEARKKRDEVTKGELSLEDYKDWLKR